MSSAMNGSVTFNFGLSFIALFIAKIAPSLRAQALLEIPLFTSQSNIESSFLSLSWLPSISKPNPPLITSPQPTPPPLCRLIQVAPLKLSPTKL